MEQLGPTLRIKKIDAVMRAGNQNKLAKLLGISPQAVSAWGEELPILQAFRLKSIRPRWFKKDMK